MYRFRDTIFLRPVNNMKAISGEARKVLIASGISSYDVRYIIKEHTELTVLQALTTASVSRRNDWRENEL